MKLTQNYDFPYLSSLVGYLRLTIIFIFFPLALSAQKTSQDTIPITDTISIGTIVLKSAGDLTFETAVDTANTLVINEFLASNSESLRDNYGDDDDWFEIYNYGDYPILVNNLCFTDDQTEPCKWKIDSTLTRFIQPHENKPLMDTLFRPCSTPATAPRRHRSATGVGLSPNTFATGPDRRAGAYIARRVPTPSPLTPGAMTQPSPPPPRAMMPPHIRTPGR